MGLHSDRAFVSTIHPQRTLKNRIKCSGIGLHSGSRVTMVLHPAAPGTGVVFRRTDITGRDPVVVARYDHVVDCVFCTTIGNADGVRIATVEHLMAAFAGCGIDNVLVELDGPEVPVMDGSAAPFVFLLECADTVDQAAPRRYLEVLKPVEVRTEEGAASLVPASRFSVAFEIDFANALVGEQNCYFQIDEATFKVELSRARTFGFARDLEAMWSRGLARGGSLENAVVVGDERVLNEEGLRYEDEFVRHKALDSIGDLYLAGAPLLGHFQGERSGHALNNRLLRALFADRSAWRLTTSPQVAAGRRLSWPAEKALATA